MAVPFRLPESELRRRAGVPAIAAVQRAIRLGHLPKLDGSTKCTDCDNPARVYDHRDYRKPLDVEPVCRSCNAKRGPALWLDCDH